MNERPPRRVNDRGPGTERTEPFQMRPQFIAVITGAAIIVAGMLALAPTVSNAVHCHQLSEQYTTLVSKNLAYTPLGLQAQSDYAHACSSPAEAQATDQHVHEAMCDQIKRNYDIAAIHKEDSAMASDLAIDRANYAQQQCAQLPGYPATLS